MTFLLQRDCFCLTFLSFSSHGDAEKLFLLDAFFMEDPLPVSNASINFKYHRGIAVALLNVTFTYNHLTVPVSALLNAVAYPCVRVQNETTNGFRISRIALGESENFVDLIACAQWPSKCIHI